MDFSEAGIKIFCPFCGRFSVDFAWIFVRFLSIFGAGFEEHWIPFLVACLGQLGVHWTADFLRQVLRVSLRSISDLTRRPVENRPEARRRPRSGRSSGLGSDSNTRRRRQRPESIPTRRPRSGRESGSIRRPLTVATSVPLTILSETASAHLKTRPNTVNTVNT
jgi:hypothetical protein